MILILYIATYLLTLFLSIKIVYTVAIHDHVIIGIKVVFEVDNLATYLQKPNKNILFSFRLQTVVTVSVVMYVSFVLQMMLCCKQ